MDTGEAVLLSEGARSSLHLRHPPQRAVPFCWKAGRSQQGPFLCLSPCTVEIHTGKIQMYFVTSVLFEITCITSNTDKPVTDSNPGVWVLIYMTNTVSTNIFRQKKIVSPTKFPWRSSGAGFLLYNRGYLSTGRICYTMHPPARNSRSQTGTPGASCTQYVAGGHRASALHTVCRAPLVAPLPASPAVPSRVQLSSAEMGVEHQDLALSARLPSQRPRRT